MKMICRLCLNDCKEYLHFFDEKGLLLKLASIVSKHFWFQPIKNDPISDIICNDCWICVDSFHQFYSFIEDSQNNFKNTELTSEEDKIFELVKVEEKENSVIEDFNNSADYLPYENDIPNKLSEDVKTQFDINPVPVPVESSKKLDVPETRKSTLRTYGRIEKPNKKKYDRIKKSDSIKIDKYKLIKNQKIDPEIEAATDLKILSFMKLICDECHEEFPKYMLLKRHMRNKHKRCGYVMCCNKKLYKRILLLEHINIHLNPDYFRCKECNKSFATKQSYDNHNLSRHQTQETRIYKCDICSRAYAKQYLLTQHCKLNHIPDDEKTWKCDMCDKRFVTKNRMMTHKNYMHKNAYSKICEICAKVCRSKSIFDRHILEHKGIVEPKIQCKQCDAWLKNVISLKKHMTRHKEETIEHVCHLCDKLAPSRGALKSHIRYVHAEASYKCTACEKCFKKPIELKEHMSTHTGEILYTCSLCPKTFNSNANMWSHKKKAHRTQWEYDRKTRKAPQDIKENLLSDGTIISKI